MKLKVAKQERLDDSTMKEVIALLEQEKPITKKDACAKLNISYNTTRLTNLITEFKQRKEREATIRRSLRGKPLDTAEKKDIIQQYLADTPISEISKSSFRTIAVIKSLLQEYGIPIKSKAASDYFKNVPLLDEKTVTENYSGGELVYSTRYGCLAEIVTLFKNTEKHGNVYRIWLLGKEQQYAYQPYYELANLSRVQQEFNISIPHTTGVMARPLQIK